jgi:bacteriocin biosynthesis cyclodehydratase domain-containing protein
MSTPLPLRPQLSLPFTVIPQGDSLHLIAGEDVRYTLRLSHPAQVAASLLRACDGTRTAEQLLSTVPEEFRSAGGDLLTRLAGERILREGPLESGHAPAAYRLEPRGSGSLRVMLTETASDGLPLVVFCQDTLDLHAAREFNREQLRQRTPWLWVSIGPMQRGLVGPVFLPDAGPCLACLLGHFQRLSPVPQLQTALMEHGRRGESFTVSPFPDEGLRILEQIVRWKAQQLARSPAPSAVFQLHVLELDAFEVATHRVLGDPTCRECANARLD